jgi:hypothetical protein
MVAGIFFSKRIVVLFSLFSFGGGVRKKKTYQVFPEFKFIAKHYLAFGFHPRPLPRGRGGRCRHRPKSTTMPCFGEHVELKKSIKYSAQESMEAKAKANLKRSNKKNHT